MNKAVRHIIHRLFVEVETDSMETGKAIGNDAAGFIAGRLAPALETLFADLEKKLEGRVLAVEKLTIDLSKTPAASDVNELFKHVYKSVEEQLSELIPAHFPGSSGHFSPVRETKALLSPQTRELGAVFHFLRTGTRPWWITSNFEMSKLMSTERLLLFSQSAKNELVTDLCTNVGENTVRRMLKQLPQEVVLQWLAAAFHNITKRDYTIAKRAHFPGQLSEAEKINTVTALIAALRLANSGTSWKKRLEKELAAIYQRFPADAKLASRIEAVIQSICGVPLRIYRPAENSQPESEKEKSAAVKENLKEVATPSATALSREKTVMKTQESREKYRQESELEFVLFENAGLILLHPFLRPFLMATGLMNDQEEFTDKELAVHVLHYLATGRENDWEHEMLFEKYLCGLALTDPLEKETAISDEMKSEADNLLGAVLGHWTGLRSSSIELLQQEFLQREAKLIEEYGTSRLLFERKTFDILMDSLPWNLGIVKLGWKSELIYVEW